MSIKKRLTAVTLIFFSGFIIIWIWLIDFTGLQLIRHYCYYYHFCYQVAQIIEQPFWQNLSNTTGTKIFDPLFWPFTLNEQDIPVEKKYQIIIREKNLKELIDNLPSNPKEFLTSKYKKKQPATLIYYHKSIPIETHFRGISSNHWINPKKSWRVYASDPIETSGRKILDFVIPEDKNFFSYFAAASFAKELNIPLPQSEIVYLSINNGAYLPYLLLEIKDSNFLEKKGITDGFLFTDRDPYPNMPPLYERSEGWEISNIGTVKQETDFTPIQRLIETMKLDDEKFTQELPLIIDMQSFYAWNTLAVLLDNTLENEKHNIFLYFNPVSGKLEFFPADISVNTYRIFENFNSTTFDYPYNPLVTRVLSIPAFRIERDNLLRSFVGNHEHLNRALAAFDKQANQATPYFLSDGLKNYSNLAYLIQVKRIKQRLEARFNLAHRILNGQRE